MSEISLLEKLYKSTETKGTFDKLVSLLGIMAEAESFKGTKKYNKESSASGIFHFLVGNGGGYNKRGQKISKGKYDANGNRKTSSFQTAQKRLSNMIYSDAYSENIEAQNLLVPLSKILKANTPDDLTEEQQAVLAFVNLKMKSSSLGNYLDGKMSADDVYGKEWVTRGKTHSDESIKTNWANAIIRGEGKNHYEYFGINAELQPASPSVKENHIPGPLKTSQSEESDHWYMDNNYMLGEEEYPYQPENERIKNIDGTPLYQLGGIIKPAGVSATETYKNIITRSKITI
jgi:hypothetical protein